SEDRSQNELYLLEELLTDVKFICDLPLAKRLEACMLLGYEKYEDGEKIYKQGDNGTLFYIIFTGSVKSSVWTQGVQDDVVTIIQASKWFGDRVLETDNLLRFIQGINHLRP
ncbi:unnamed protein product, partial [Sphagnum troendelagicum]